MRKGTLAAWIGLLFLLVMGIGLLLRTQMGVGAVLANTAIVYEREPSEVRQHIVPGESEQRSGDEQSLNDRDGRVRRTAVDSVLTAPLPSPPPPSRVLPGQLPESDESASEKQRHLLPSPPVPSKVLPEPE